MLRTSLVPVSAITGCPLCGRRLWLRWRYYGYWMRLWRSYVETEHRADYQTMFYCRCGGGKLIWTGITRSVDLSTTHSITDDISRVLVPDSRSRVFSPAIKGRRAGRY